MSYDDARIWPYALALLAVFVVYRRLRRSFGRQALRPARMGFRIALLVLLACSLVPTALRSGQFLLGDLAGLVAGVALGLWGARHTRFQTSDGRMYYIPHTYTGIAVSLLFLGRLAYRLVELSSADRALGSAVQPMVADGHPAMMQSPLTLGLLFVVVGYYVCYYSVVLWKSKHIGPDDVEARSASRSASTVSL